MEQGLIILLRLLVAHITSDFILQSNKMRDGKKGMLENQTTSTKCLYLLCHSLIHAIVSYIFVAQWDNWKVPLIIFVTHLIVDSVKSIWRRDSLLLFAIDQIVHIIILLLLWWIMFKPQIDICTWTNEMINNEQIWIIIFAYIFVTKPTSIILNLFFRRWDIDDDTQASTDEGAQASTGQDTQESTESMKGLPEAGKWIGYIERVLVLTFVITSQVEMVGFLIAAKSIFRFGELKKAREIKITEYVLIGTLASFTVAIISGFIVNYLIKLL